MRWHWLGLIQLFVLTAHLCASPFGMVSAEWPTPDRHTTFEMGSELKEASPFAPEEKSYTKPISLAVRTHSLPVNLPSPAATPERFFGTPETAARLAGFQLRVSERPPPSCL